MKREAGSWAGTSVHIERMTHMSSTQSPSARKTSLTSMPDCRACELERRRVSEAGQAGQRLVFELRERRLGVERVDVRRRAAGEDVDDVLGLGVEVRLVRRQRVVRRARDRAPTTAAGDELAAEAKLSFSSIASDIAPMPMPHLCSNSRRVIA
jgi:hypothetical protein